MKLFVDVYLDEDVSRLIAKLLQARGYDAITTHDEDMLGQDDPSQLAHAISIGRCIITHNRVDFELLHSEYMTTGKNHYGVILATRRSPYEVTRRLVVLLNTYTADEFENQLFYI